MDDKLRQSIDAMTGSGRLPHAVIIEGGADETERAALYLANAAVCGPAHDVADSTGSIKKPCGKCNGCRKAKSGNHPDIIGIRGSGDAGKETIKIENARKLRQDAYIMPNEAARKVYILYNAGTMTEQAANALLKVLEEPPAYALFILTCESGAALLPTIRSRAVCISGKSAPTGDGEAASQAAKIAEAAAGADGLAVLKLLKPLEKKQKRAEYIDTLSGLKQILITAAGAKQGAGTATNGAEQRAVRLLSEKMTAKRLIKLAETADNMSVALNANANGALVTAAFAASIHNA